MITTANSSSSIGRPPIPRRGGRRASGHRRARPRPGRPDRARRPPSAGLRAPQGAVDEDLARGPRLADAADEGLGAGADPRPASGRACARRRGPRRRRRCRGAPRARASRLKPEPSIASAPRSPQAPRPRLQARHTSAHGLPEPPVRHPRGERRGRTQTWPSTRSYSSATVRSSGDDGRRRPRSPARMAVGDDLGDPAPGARPAQAPDGVVPRGTQARASAPARGARPRLRTVRRHLRPARAEREPRSANRPRRSSRRPTHSRTRPC